MVLCIGLCAGDLPDSPVRVDMGQVLVQPGIGRSGIHGLHDARRNHDFGSRVEPSSGSV